MKTNKSYLLSSIAFLVSIMLLSAAPTYAVSHSDGHEKMDEKKEMMDDEKTSDDMKADGMMIDINKANAKQLTKLAGVGKKKAAAIVKYRKKNGPFMKVKDLLKVKGIGKAVLKKNKDMLMVAKPKK